MAMREEFDQYLLLKKLAEDPLGETFRAGRVGSGSLDQVVLLRVLNGPRLDGTALARELPQRAGVQQALKSPNIGNGVGLGAFRGVPFLAYDYVSGRNLASLLQQADQQRSPIPTDHALLVAERIALALAAAGETRVQDQRLTHGFLVPHLIMISNEGETRVLGFEAGALLARQAAGGTFEPEISAYLAPELVAGQGPNRADDVYSLGAVLYQLLTGAHPTADLHAHLERIDQAATASEGEPLAADVAALLKKSLAPREQRFPDAASLHRALSKVLVEGHYTANTFNLAFFMHNLFRSEIERESQEIEAEKRIQPPPAATSTTTVAIPRASVEDALAAPSASPESTGTHTATGAATSRSGRGLWLSLAALLLLAGAAGGGYYWYLQRQSAGTASGEMVDATLQPTLPPSSLDGGGTALDGAAEAVPEEPPVPAGPTPEEVQAQLQSMIDARSREMEEKLKTQYDDRIRNLQSQLEQTQQAAAAREAERQKEVERIAAERKAAQEAQLRREEEARKAAAAAAAPPPETTSPGGTTGVGGAAARPPAGGSAEPVQAEPPVPKVTQVKPPELLRRPDPRYPPIARRVGKEATVVLRVLVDSRGQVSKVEQISAKSGFGIDQAAEEAAYEAEYRPGTEDGKPKEMWTTIRFTFRP